MVNKDSRDDYDSLLEIGTFSVSPNGTRPSISAGSIRRPLLRAVGLLLLLSLVSSAIAFWHVKHSNSTLGHLELDRTDEGASVGESWHIINATTLALAPIDATERPTLAETFSTPECIDAWIATGTLCNHIMASRITQDMRNALKMSIIHTWVNGSDQQFHAWKEAVAKDRRPPTKGKVLWLPGDASRHFRDHNELVHSLRSVISSLRQEEIADFHLVTGDLPLRGNDSVPMEHKRMGQKPTWLDLRKICPTKLNLHHHWDLFKMRLQGATELEASSWRDRILPTFNSIGIETQLVTLAPELTDTFLYFNDDFFLTQKLTRSDFSSPLFGSVFRMQNNVRVTSSAKGTSRLDPEGEWPSLGYANWLLDQRFGGRTRPYLAHFVKTFSSPLLQEVTTIWGKELTESAEVRFRGAGRGTAFGLAFFASNYVVERHREALLWSFLIARSDRDSSGTYSAAERRILLTEVGFTNKQSNGSLLVVPEPIRQPKNEVEETLSMAGFGAPLSTHYSFTSHESGYAYNWLKGRPVLTQAGSYVMVNQQRPPPANHGWPHYRPGDNTDNQIACTLDFLDCFGAEFMSEGGDTVSVQDTFKRLSFEKPLCGDCIISSLLGASGRTGMSAFLPPPSRSPQRSNRVALSMSKNWTDAEYNSDGGRARAVSLLQRYSYVLGDSAAELVALSNSYAMRRRFNSLLAAIRRPDGPAFVVLNDDMPERTAVKESKAMDTLILEWMEKLWPTKLCWEY